MQNDYYPGYDLVTRALFYCAKMLSAQLDTEFTPKNYDDIKKVYSIWICMDAPRYAEYTITRYHINKEDIYGHVSKENRYDLMEAVMICLGKEDEVQKGNKLHGMLSTLLSDTLTPSEKEDILEQEYNIETSVEIEGGIDGMCNLSDRIEQRGIERGIYSLIEALQELGMSKVDTQAKVQEKYNLEDEKACAYMEKYWK